MISCRKFNVLNARKSLHNTFIPLTFAFSSIKQIYHGDKINEYQHLDNDIDSKLTKVIHPLTIQEKIKLSTESFVSHLLPKGYPHTVATNYDKFVLCQMISAFLSSAGGVLSMQSLLYAAGLGASSLPLAATLNWIIKDGLGQLGGVLFASFINNRFDADPKRWRFLASIALEISNCIEIISPFFPNYFLFLASFANFGKNVSALAHSASRAAIHKSFALQENLADLTARTASQNMLAATLGTSFGVASAAWIANDFSMTVNLFGTLSISGLIMTYVSMQYVTINSLSLSRYEYLLHNYFMTNKPSLSILTPKDLRQAEVFFSIPNTLTHLPKFRIGEDVDVAFPSNRSFDEIRQIFAKQSYILNIRPSISSEGSSSSSTSAVTLQDPANTTVHLLFYQDATLQDLLQGIAHAYLVRKMIVFPELKSWSKIQILQQSIDILNGQNPLQLTDQLLAKHNIHEFIDRLLQQKEWHIAENLLELRYARLQR